MNLIKTLIAVAIPLLIAGCGTMKEIQYHNIATEFDRSARSYNKMLRWHELDNAETTYVTPKLRDDYRERIIAAGEVNIIDYRVKSMECFPEKGEGSVRVELDYVRPPSVTLRTLVDRQQWSYEGEEGSRAWRLITLLPDFK